MTVSREHVLMQPESLIFEKLLKTVETSETWIESYKIVLWLVYSLNFSSDFVPS